MMKQTLVMSNVSDFNPLNYLIVFISTILVYQLAVSGVRFPFIPNHIHRNKSWMGTMLLLLIILTILVMKTLSSAAEFLLLCILISCFAYFTSVKTWKGLRAIPAVKGILLALAWSMVTVVFPLINDWNWNTHFILLLQRFLFMLAICIIYNLRDVDMDRKHGVVTIASMFGEKNTRIVGLTCLLAFVMSVVFYASELKYILMGSALVTAIAISKAKINGSVFYYRYIIDGCMMLQSLLIICSK